MCGEECTYLALLTSAITDTPAKISLCEMYKIVPQILRTYHLSLVDGAQDWETHNYWFHKTSGVNTKVQVRNVDEVISKIQG